MNVTCINQGVGSIRVHRDGCRDIARESRGGSSVWTVADATMVALVEDTFPQDEFERYDGWTYAGAASEFRIMPCVGVLPWGEELPWTADED